MTSKMRAETLATAEVARDALTRQADVIDAVAARARTFGPQGLVTVARGTSDHAAEYALRLVAQELGLIGSSLPPSLVTLNRAPLRFDGKLVLAVSQSGRSPDLVEPVRAARAGGALTVALVNQAQSPLAEAAEHVIAVDAGAELSVAATKSYALSLLQIARLVAAWSGREALASAIRALPAPLDDAVATDWSAALDALAKAASLFVVGRGLAYATAREAALKLKETCGLHAEAVSGAEIMHGPKALIEPDAPLLMFTGSDVPAPSQAATAGALAALTGGLLVAGASESGHGQALVGPAAGDPALQPILDIVPFYLLADALSHRRGLSPDRPRHLAKVTETR